MNVPPTAAAGRPIPFTPPTPFPALSTPSPDSDPFARDMSRQRMEEMAMAMERFRISPPEAGRSRLDETSPTLNGRASRQSLRIEPQSQEELSQMRDTSSGDEVFLDQRDSRAPTSPLRHLRRHPDTPHPYAPPINPSPGRRGLTWHRFTNPPHQNPNNGREGTYQPIRTHTRTDTSRGESQ